jgi:hypothetical protein
MSICRMSWRLTSWQWQLKCSKVYSSQQCNVVIEEEWGIQLVTHHIPQVFALRWLLALGPKSPQESCMSEHTRYK